MEQIIQKFINAQNHEERLNVLRSMTVKELRSFMKQEYVKPGGRSKEDIVRYILAKIEYRYIKLDAGKRVTVAYNPLSGSFILWATKIAEARKNHVSNDILTEEMIDAEYEAYCQSKFSVNVELDREYDFKDLTKIFKVVDGLVPFKFLRDTSEYDEFEHKARSKMNSVEYWLACVLSDVVNNKPEARLLRIKHETVKILKEFGKIVLKNSDDMPKNKDELSKMIYAVYLRYEEYSAGKNVIEVKAAQTQKDYRKVRNAEGFISVVHASPCMMSLKDIH